ncbi:MAG: transglutaminaseTgpA domain-containing protein [Pseudomonadales bacterium]
MNAPTVATHVPAAARGVAYQIPRNSLALLMIAQAAVLAPFALQLSPWIIAVGLFCGYWRTGVFQGRWDYPRRWIKVVLVLASIGGVAVSGVEPFSLEAAASLLILAFALKLIEMKSRRDAYLVIFLGYFIIATQFLFDQSIAVSAYQLGALVVVTAAMVGMNQQATRVRPLESLRLALVLVLQALPLTVMLFLFFPRVAPLWGVPLPSAASTGISDRMKPGDVAELTRSDELAFRVVFDGPVPANRDLYWRGLVYSRFQEGTWSVGGMLPGWGEDGPPQEPEDGLRLDYEVLLEPTQSDWLFALETALPRTPGVALARDYRLVAPDPVLSVFRYRASSYPALRTDALAELPEALRLRETWLPAGDNARVRAFANELRQAHPDAAGFVRAVLTQIRSQPFFYTLQPPTLPDRDSIDRFWFETRRGFCTHYAGAMVFMLRSVGIPARLVGGYQGGEINPVTGHLVVRQYDAHAWAEYWEPGAGWLRVDPTSAVAPARIEQGLSAALSAEDRAALSALTGARMSGLAAFRDLLHWMDSLEHRWNLWVVGYDVNLQAGLLGNLLGEITPARVIAAVLGGGGLSVALVALSLFWRRRPRRRHPVELAFSRFCQGVAGAGWQRSPAEPPATFLRRLGTEAGLAPAQVEGLVADLDRLLYNPDARHSPRALRQLRSQLRRLQFRLMIDSVR